MNPQGCGAVVYMYKPPRFSAGLVAFLAESGSPAELIVERARRLSNGTDFVLVLRPEEGIEDRFIPAYISAMIRSKDGIARSRSIALEVMMLMAGTMNIGKAVERCAPKGNVFAVFASGKELSDRIVSEFGMKITKRYRLRLDHRASGRVALTAARYG